MGSPIGDLAPHGNIYDKDKKICISPLEDTEYPSEDQEVIPDTSEHVDEEDEEEISVVQEDRGDNLVSYIQSQRGKFDIQIEVDGKLYFKAL